MASHRRTYRGYRFPPEIISHAVWLYHRFSLSFRDVEDLLAERGVVVSYEAIRQWCEKFAPGYAAKLKRRQGRLDNPHRVGRRIGSEELSQPPRMDGDGRSGEDHPDAGE